MKTKRISRTNQIIAATKKQAARAVSAGLEEAEEVMKFLVPVDQGDLSSTIEKDDNGQGKGSIRAGGESKISDKFVDYELHVEYGTDETAAQPFFRPGLDAGRRKMKSEMKIKE